MKMATNYIWKNKEYLKFFASYTIGNIGDWFDVFALQIIFAHEFQASAMLLAILMIVYLAPMAFFSSYAGIFADRFNKKNVLMLTDILSGVATLFIILSNNIILSLLIVFIRSSFASLNAQAQPAALKYIVNEEELLPASSYNQIVAQLCQVIGPMLGAFVVIMSSAYWCLGINALSFFVSALLLLSLKPLQEIKDVFVNVSETKFIPNLKLTLSIIKANKKLLNILILTSLISIPVMMGFSQLVLLLKLLYPNNQSILGVMSGINGCGAIVAGVYLSRKKDLTHYIIYLVLSTIFLGASNIAFALYPEHFYLLPLYVASFINGAGFGIGMIIFSYLRTKEVSHEYVERVSGTMNMFMSTCYLIGLLLGGIITTLIGVRATFLAMGIMTFLIMLYTILIKAKFSD